jgi:hypothetical protein
MIIRLCYSLRVYKCSESLYNHIVSLSAVGAYAAAVARTVAGHCWCVQLGKCDLSAFLCYASLLCILNRCAKQF